MIPPGCFKGMRLMVQVYLKDLFTRLPAAKITQIKGFTPAGWVKTKARERAASRSIVNGRVVIRLYNAERIDNGAPEPISSGKISLQAEGGECFFRNVEVSAYHRNPG
jgi:hypothetical protein